jgi:hypothetical protein
MTGQIVRNPALLLCETPAPTAGNRLYGAATVRTTGAWAESEVFPFATVSMPRKNTSADIEGEERFPAATITSPLARLVYPELASRDQRIGAGELEVEADAIERTQARVAFTLSEIPWVDSFRALAPRAGVADSAIAPTCTFTRGGTVTLTV